jgi:hypothetical protein
MVVTHPDESHPVSQAFTPLEKPYSREESEQRASQWRASQTAFEEEVARFNRNWQRLREAMSTQAGKARCVACGYPRPDNAHNCLLDADHWRYVTHFTKDSDAEIFVSHYDPDRWARGVRGMGIVELLPRHLIPEEWRHMSNPPEEPDTFRPVARDPFEVRPDDPPVVSYRLISEGILQRHLAERGGATLSKTPVWQKAVAPDRRP